MWTNVNNSFTVAFSDEVQTNVVSDLPTQSEICCLTTLGKWNAKLHSLFIHITKRKEWFHNV